jgi:hypothetical protein
MGMEIFLTITNNKNYGINLIPCKSYGEAIRLMKDTYETKLIGREYDLNNTFLDEESGYAQIVSGFEQTEFRIGYSVV